jgi:cytochrome c-type biogenesis protein CcmH/NrfF
MITVRSVIDGTFSARRLCLAEVLACTFLAGAAGLVLARADELDDRVRVVASQLRCPVCSNL